MVSPVYKAIRYALDPTRTEGRLMVERGIGYWISPDDEFVPLPPRVSHADVMRALVEPATLDENAAEAFAVDPNTYALSVGWTRVRIYPGEKVAYVDFGAGRGKTHGPLTQDLVDQLGLAGVRIKFTDEDGNYVSP